MSETVHAARGGAFATSRRGSIAEDFDFIRAKASEGVPATAIAHMIGRSADEVRGVITCSVEREPPSVARKPSYVPMSSAAAQIAREVADKHGVSVADIRRDCRTRAVVKARWELFYRLRETGRYSLPQIGRAVGGKDHSTVINGIRQHEAMLQAKGVLS